MVFIRQLVYCYNHEYGKNILITLLSYRIDNEDKNSRIDNESCTHPTIHDRNK